MDFGSPETILATVFTVCGGVLLKVLEWWFKPASEEIPDATDLQQRYQELGEQYRKHAAELEEKVSDLEKSRNEWQAKYYDQRDKHSELEAQIRILEHHLSPKLNTPVDPPNGS